MLQECLIGDVEHTIEVICMNLSNARKRKRDSIPAALDIILTSPTNIKNIVLKNLKNDILLDLANLSPSAMSKEELKTRIKMHALYVVRKAIGL